jgi:hypothetical protein
MSDTVMDKLLVVEANEFAALAFLALAVSRLPSAEREKTLQAI